MNPHYFILSIFGLTGLISLLAALLNWDWFFNAQNLPVFVRRYGRKWARWFYGGAGVLLIGMSVLFLHLVRSSLK